MSLLPSKNGSVIHVVKDPLAGFRQAQLLTGQFLDEFLIIGPGQIVPQGGIGLLLLFHLNTKGLLLRLLLCLIINNILHLLLYMACFRGIGMEVTIYQALFYNSVSRMLSLVAIVPANIGIAQGVMGAAGSLMGDVFQHGVMVSLLQSVALMVVYIVMGGLFAYPVYRRYSKGC